MYRPWTGNATMPNAAEMFDKIGYQYTCFLENFPTFATLTGSKTHCCMEYLKLRTLLTDISQTTLPPN